MHLFFFKITVSFSFHNFGNSIINYQRTMKTQSILLTALLFATITFAQTIPANKRVQWTNAGSFSSNPIISNQINVMNFGAHGDSLNDNAHAIDSAINSLNGHAGIIFFPPGNYLVKSTINLPDSVILRGDCYDSAQLIFDLNGSAIDCIDAQTIETGTFRNIVSGYQKESTTIALDSTTGFNVGDYAEIQETNGAWNSVPISWAVNCVGQIIHITAINGNSITFENPLRITYSAALNPQIRKWVPRVFVGIEDLKITRQDAGLPASGYQINFYNAMNCWVKGVESSHSVGAHVAINVCTNITVSGCYFHDAYAYDGTGTRGYGVMMIQHAGQCLVENNVFNHLRHSIIVKQGANGNVAGYNFCINGYRSETPNTAGADLVCHGHYSFANLFEGNIVNNIMVDSTWGPTGPYTTFFRNRAALYGFIMTSGASVLSDSLNFVGNETTDHTIFYGLFFFAGINHFMYGNDSLGTIIPSGTNTLPDTSYYRTSFNDIFSSAPYPPTVGIPNVNGTGTIPAMQRFTAGGRMTVSPNPPCIYSGIEERKSLQNIFVFPNPANKNLYIKANLDEAVNIEIYSMDGKIVYAHPFPKDQGILQVNTASMTPGIYFLKVMGAREIYVSKICIEQ